MGLILASLFRGLFGRRRKRIVVVVLTVTVGPEEIDPDE